MAGPGETNGKSSRLRNIVRALDSRNAKLYFSGQGVSLIGTWMTRVASAWLVYRLTDNAFLLGLLGFAGQAPTFLLAPFAGVWIDRWDRQKTLVVTQVAAMIQSLLLALVAALSFAPMTTFWLIVALNLLQGVINAFDTPARQSFLIDFISKREALPNAIALNSSMVHMARLIGPSIAGVLIGLFGEVYCFLFDGLSYIFVVGALLAMRVKTHVGTVKIKGHVWEGLVEGARYAFGFGPIRAILLLISVMALMGMPHNILMPIVARDILGGDATTLGFLNACSGVGALTGAIYLASRSSVVGLGRVLSNASIIFSVALGVFAMSQNIWLSSISLLFTGYGLIIVLAAGNTILQTLVDDDKRGRVMSLYTTAFLGVTPFGSLLAGVAAEHFGAPKTLLVGSVVCLLAALAFARNLPLLRTLARPVYLRKGVLTDIAVGLQNAAEASKAAEE